MRTFWRMVAVTLALTALAQPDAPAPVPPDLLQTPLRLVDLPPVLWSPDLPAALPAQPHGCLCSRLLDDLGRYRLMTLQRARQQPGALLKAPDPEVQDAGFHTHGQ
jgi:hypothetical protein